MSYSTQHRAFLQAIIQHDIITDQDMRELVVKIFGNTSLGRANDIFSFIADVNRKLEPLNMMIKAGICEVTSEKYWTLISTVLDEVTRFQVEFLPGQLELLRKVFSEIIVSADGSAPSTRCLNFCSSLDSKITKSDADEFLNSMVARKWLGYKNGKYYMGMRSIAELMPYFRATYEKDVFNTCSLCRQVVFHGKRCPHCQEILHLFCLANYALARMPLKCPSCSNAMSTNVLDESIGVGETNEENVNVGEKFLCKKKR